MQNENLTSTLLIEEAKNNLAVYTGLVHKTDTGGPAIPPDHMLNFVIPVLENEHLGHTTIVAPPGSAKTNTMIAACCWYLGNNPNMHIAYVSSTATQAKQRSVAIRNIIEYSKDYQAIFPNTKPDKRLGWSEAEWFLERPDFGDKNPTMIISGTPGNILGARLDLIVLDDIADEENMATALQRQKVIDFLQKTIDTRLTPTGRIVSIATRWSEKDPVNWSIEQGWKKVHIKAINDKGQSYWPDYWPVERLACPDNMHGKIINEDGSTACMLQMLPSGKTRPINCKKRAGARGFAQQYQGEVFDDDSSIIKRNWWKYYTKLPEKENNEVQLKGGIFIDTAHTEKTYSDYSVILIMYTDGHRFYIENVFRKKLEFPALKREILAIKARYDLPIHVEDTVGSKALISDLQKEFPNIIPYKNQGKSKLARLEAVLSNIEGGGVLLKEKQPWLDDFLAETEAFPSSQHDDQVDALAMALNIFTIKTVKWTTV